MNYPNQRGLHFVIHKRTHREFRFEVGTLIQRYYRDFISAHQKYVQKNFVYVCVLDILVYALLQINNIIQNIFSNN